MTTELNASQTERGAETGTNVGQPWEAKFMNLDRLLTPESLGPQHNPSEVGSMIAAVANSARDARNQLRESLRPEVEALQARVRELEEQRQSEAYEAIVRENRLLEARLSFQNAMDSLVRGLLDTDIVKYADWFNSLVADAKARLAVDETIAKRRATLEGKD